jgi:hypothetical protein
MTKQADGVLLTDGRSSVFLHPPELYGGSGFHHLVEFVGGPFQGGVDASSYEDPTGFNSFTDS